MNPQLKPETQNLLNKGNQLISQFNAQQPIDSSKLQNAKPMTVTSPRPSTEPAGLQGAIDTATSLPVDAFVKDLQTKTQTAEEQKNSSLKERITGMLGLKGETALQDQAYSKTVDPVEAELKDINQQLLTEKESTRRRVEELQKNPQGLFGGALNDEVNRLNRESLSKQADLSVIQLGIQGRYDSAKAIADRAVQMKIEQQKIENDALKLAYDENKEAFTTAEKRLFETQQNDRERALDQEERNLKEISDLSIQALQDGAPSSVVSAMRGAKTPEEAIRLGGSYVGALDRQLKNAQLAKAYQDLQAGPKKTDTQVKATGFAQRMIEAGQIVDAIGSQFAGIDSYVGQALPNPLKSEDRQKFEQAQRNFINAVLRRESGAVISEEEFSNARQQYFPQPGDTSGVLEQKRQNRLTSTNSLLNESGVEQIQYTPQNNQTKTVNGKTYIKVEGGWQLQ